MPPRSAKSRSRPRIQRMPSGSRPLAGSSRISTSRVAEQRVREAEPLAHAERVLAHPLAWPRACPARRASSSSSTRASRHAHHQGADGQRLAAAAAGVLGGASSSTPTRRPGVGERAVVAVEHRRAARVGRRRARPASASSWSCRRRWARGTRSRCPGSQRNETSLTTARPPRRFVSPVASIMAGSIGRGGAA